MDTQRHHYDIDIKWKKGGTGTMSSPVLSKKMDVATPPEFPGGIEGVWSPEHLFVASVAGCFMTTFLAIAEFSKLDYEDLDIKSSGVMAKKDGKWVMSEITLRPKLVITDESKTDKAIRIMQKAEAACLISRSINSRVILEPKVKIMSASVAPDYI